MCIDQTCAGADMPRNMTVITRTNLDENTVAVVQWNGVSLSQLLRRLIVAVTEWVRTTKEGKQAWKNSSEDFNVADLSACLPVLPGDPLHDILAKYGIEDLDIDVFQDTDPDPNWTYDTVLVDETDLEEFHSY
jgi:hypothetical protein